LLDINIVTKIGTLTAALKGSCGVSQWVDAGEKLAYLKFRKRVSFWNCLTAICARVRFGFAEKRVRGLPNEGTEMSQQTKKKPFPERLQKATIVR
jgi:hypothetical protein